MSLELYEVSVPVFRHMLGNLRELLRKAAVHAEARKFDGLILAQSRLFPDMLPLSSQVQIACDMAKNGAARLTGQDPPKFDDTEKTLDELLARVERTLSYLEGFRPEQFAGSESRAITLQLRSGTQHFDGKSYLLNFVLPNLYFHISTAYNLLRHNGVEIGKADFLGRK